MNHYVTDDEQCKSTRKAYSVMLSAKKYLLNSLHTTLHNEEKSIVLKEMLNVGNYMMSQMNDTVITTLAKWISMLQNNIKNGLKEFLRGVMSGHNFEAHMEGFIFAVTMMLRGHFENELRFEAGHGIMVMREFSKDMTKWVEMLNAILDE